MNYDLQKIAKDIEEIRSALSTNKRALTFNEGCRYTGFAPSYMYKMTSAGIVPFSKPNGKTIFFDKEKLDQWLLSNGTKSNNEKEVLASTYVSINK